MARTTQNTHELIGPLKLLKKSFLLYRDRFKAFTLLGAMAFGVGVIQFFAIYIHSILLFTISVFASIVVSYIVYLAMVRVASAPGSMTAGLALSRIEQFVFPALWVSMLMMLTVLGGTLLLIVPGIIVSVFIMFALFAVIVEHCQQMDAILHSWQIVRGRWWSVFWRLFVGAIVLGLISWIIVGTCWLLGFGETPLETVRRTAAGDFEISMTQAAIEQLIANLLSLPLAISFLAVFYEELRRTAYATFTPGDTRIIKRYIRVLVVLGITVLAGGLFFSSLRLLQIIPELIMATHAPAAVFSAF